MNTETAEKSLVRGSSGRQLLVVTTGTMTFTTGQFVLSPLLPNITRALSISSTEAGVALSMLFGAMALSRYPGGRLSDALTRKTVIVGGLAATVGGFALLAVVADYPTFLVAVTAVGTGIGLYSVTAIAHLSDLFGPRQGQALGINNSSIYVAGVLGAVVANAAIAFEDWRVAFLPVASVLSLLLVAVHRWNDAYVLARPEFDPGGAVGRTFRSGRARRMLVVGVLFGVTWQGVVTFLPTFLRSEKAFSGTLASNLFALLFLVGVVANLVGGRLADEFGVPYVIAGVAGLGTTGLAVVVVGGAVPVVAAGIVALGVGLAGVWPVIQAYMMELFPDESKGGDYGVFSAVYLGIASLGPALTGFVGDRAGFAVAFGLLAACLLGSTVLALGIRRR